MKHVRFHQKVIVLNSEGKMLALKASYKGKKWDIPGGAVDFSELHMDALKRECKEEAEIDVVDIKPIEVQTSISDEDRSYYLFIGYTARMKEENNIVLSDEHTEYRWVAPEEFLELDATEYLKSFVRTWVQNRDTSF